MAAERTAISDRDGERASVQEVRDAHRRPERQRAMRTRHPVLVESLTARGLTQVKRGPVPRRPPDLRCGSRVLLGSHRDGSRDDDGHEDDRQPTADPRRTNKEPGDRYPAPPWSGLHAPAPGT